MLKCGGNTHKSTQKTKKNLESKENICPECGTVVKKGKFCPECGSKKPEAPAGWTCACGATATGKFCPECGDIFDDNDIQ